MADDFQASVLTAPPVILVLGASGFIGCQVAFDLMRDGFLLVAVARRFSPSQKALFLGQCVECEIMALDAPELARLFEDRQIDIVVNCLGVLQDGPSGRTVNVHRGFVDRLVAAMGAEPQRRLLVHLSIPGVAAEDCTAFSRTKREADRIIIGSSLPYVILRPGFVIGPAAYGGSALIRALAGLPLALSSEEGSRPFAATDIHDIARTIAVVTRRWVGGGEPQFNVVWDVLEPHPQSVDAVIAAHRRRLGLPAPTLRLPAWVSRAGAWAGDICAQLGWASPIRTTARREMLRGIAGDPGPWSTATGIEPPPVDAILTCMPASVQEIWFARLYLAKPLIIGTLAMFWIVSGTITLTLGREAGIAIFTTHGVPFSLACFVTVVTSLCDIGLGIAIAVRRTCAMALLAGVALSLVYLVGAAVLTPELWADPTGALVKTVPTILLMLVALAVLPNR